MINKKSLSFIFVLVLMSFTFVGCSKVYDLCPYRTVWVNITYPEQGGVSVSDIFYDYGAYTHSVYNISTSPTVKLKSLSSADFRSFNSSVNSFDWDSFAIKEKNKLYAANLVAHKTLLITVNGKEIPIFSSDDIPFFLKNMTDTYNGFIKEEKFKCIVHD